MKNKSIFSRLLDNKKILFIIAIVLSFFIWLISSDDITKSIDDVKLNYSLSESVSDDLKIYSASVETVSVKVTGKRVLVDSLSPDDFTVTVDLSAVTEPGTGTYPIVVELKDNLDVEITETEPKSITLMVDSEMSKTVDVISEFSYTPEDYYLDHNAPTSIDITGPETYVSQVESAYITGTVNSPNAVSISKAFEIKLYDNKYPTAKGAKEIPSDYITMSYETADITFRFLKLTESMPFSLDYEPETAKIHASYYKITPSSISIAGPEYLISGAQAIDSLAIDIGSLSKYKNQVYNAEYDLAPILGNDFVNKSEGVESVSVQLDFSSLSSKTYDVSGSRIKINNLPEGYTIDIPQNYPVTVIGTESSLIKIKESDFTIIYDFENVDTSSGKTVNVPVKITIESLNLCWAYKPNAYDTVTLKEK